VRIGTYIDGVNLYYGARGLYGRGTPGWRWLDLRGLVTDLVGRRISWAGASIDRVVYCTARIDAAANSSGHADQDVYLKALVAFPVSGQAAGLAGWRRHSRLPRHGRLPCSKFPPV
jgi:hypothetical protein